jgi:hypothetical protein
MDLIRKRMVGEHGGALAGKGRVRGIPPLRRERARMGQPSSVFWFERANEVKGGGQECPPYRDYCLILGFTAEYSKSVRKFTATYVSPIARMHPCTR